MFFAPARAPHSTQAKMLYACVLPTGIGRRFPAEISDQSGGCIMLYLANPLKGFSQPYFASICTAAGTPRRFHYFLYKIFGNYIDKKTKL